MYVARDKNGALWLYREKPHRDFGVWFSDSINIMQINREEFPQLKWEDEPIEVKLNQVSDVKKI